MAGHRPSVVLLQDPTQGVDVGAREGINQRLLEAADAGTAVLCATPTTNNSP